MRRQKRVEDARKRAYDPRIHQSLRKSLSEDDWIAGSSPAMTNFRGDDNHVHRAPAHSGGGNVTHLRSSMLRWHASAKATSRMPAVKSHASGAPAATWRRKASHPTR